MSDIKELIRENNRNAKKSRMINNILWGIVSILVAVSFYASFNALAAKAEAVQEKEAKELALVEKQISLVLADSLRIVAEGLVDDLKISEENLQGEKNKLELFKTKYDSIRQITLNQTDDLWEYAMRENTIESYTDYVKIKGMSDNVVDKIKSLLQNTGYVQIEESNGNMLISPISREFGLWKGNSARSIRNGVIGNSAYNNQTRNGDVILKEQPFVILEDSIMSGRARWAKIAY